MQLWRARQSFGRRRVRRIRNRNYEQEYLGRQLWRGILSVRIAKEIDLALSGSTSSAGKSRPVLAYIRLLRPQQWTKNLLVLAPLVFADQFSTFGQCVRAFTMFVAFCAISSATYVFNDLIDREADRAHPRKRNRPIASGKVRSATALLFVAALVAIGFLLAHGAPKAALACIAGYLVLQAGYATLLKKLVILDVISIAAGFVLRAVAGAYAIEVTISPWLLICTILLALFLALSKRRSELLASDNPAAYRPVLEEYNLAFLDQLIAIVTSCTVLAYILYTFSDQTMQKFPSHLMPMTLPFVLYGVFRYLYLIYRRSEGGEPELLLVKDIPLLIDIVLWGAAVAAIASLG
jgi:4-hydroxybenzoate polyprenyltransferase